MKIGYLTPYSPDEVAFAAEAGFGSLELNSGSGETMNAEKILSGGAEEMRSTTKKYGIEISALACYVNHLNPDLEKRKQRNDYLRKLIDAAKALGVGVVCTFAGRMPELSVEQNIPIFKEVFSPLAEYAQKQGVKIAIENCPMMHGHPFRGDNIAYSPYVWEMMFDAVDSDYLGLEFDPSHLYWQQIDEVAATRKFGDKIYHVHAKDTEIMSDVLAYRGVMEPGWWRFRVPGWGEVDWQGFISALIDAGYDGSLAIEHEDPVFHGDRFREGLKRGLKFLSQFLV